MLSGIKKLVSRRGLNDGNSLQPVPEELNVFKIKDLLKLIIGNLGVNDLFKLSRVCKQWNELANQELEKLLAGELYVKLMKSELHCANKRLSFWNDICELNGLRLPFDDKILKDSTVRITKVVVANHLEVWLDSNKDKILKLVLRDFKKSIHVPKLRMLSSLECIDLSTSPELSISYDLLNKLPRDHKKMIMFKIHSWETQARHFVNVIKDCVHKDCRFDVVGG